MPIIPACSAMLQKKVVIIFSFHTLSLTMCGLQSTAGWDSKALMQIAVYITLLSHHHILARGRRRRRLRHLIWLAVIWSLWITRNKSVFERGTFGINEGVTKIKYLSWGWFIWRERRKTLCTFSAWWSGR